MLATQRNIRICIWLMASIFLLCHPTTAHSQNRYTVTTDILNVRSESSTGAAVAGVLHRTDTVSVLSQSDGWGTILYNGDSCYVNMSYLSMVREPSDFGKWIDEHLTFVYIVIALIVLLYIFCVIMVQGDNMVVIGGWIDLCFMVVPWLIIGLFLMSVMFSGEDNIETDKTMLIVGASISGLLLVISLVKTVVANLDSPLLIIPALLMKIIILPIIPLGLLAILFHDRSTRSGILGTLKAVLFVGLIVYGLMSFDD